MDWTVYIACKNIYLINLYLVCQEAKGALNILMVEIGKIMEVNRVKIGEELRKTDFFNILFIAGLKVIKI